MHLDKFYSFFEIVTSLCFLYAGSEMFRAAFNETVLRLNAGIDGIKSDLEEKEKKLHLATAEKFDRAATELIAVAQTRTAFTNLKTEEEAFRNFPNAMKSSFLMTGLFGLAVLLLAGYAQFFKCNETQLITLSIFNLVIFYNIVVWIRTHWRGRCDKDPSMRWPISIILFLALVAFIYTMFMPWVDKRCIDALDQGTEANWLRALQNGLDPEFLKSVASAIKSSPSPFMPLSNVDLRAITTLTIFTSISPFIFHVFRVSLHKTRYLKRYKELQTQFTDATATAERVAEMIRKPAKADGGAAVKKKARGIPSAKETATTATIEAVNPAEAARKAGRPSKAPGDKK